MPAVSRLTSKSQTTIPREVREKLSLRPGDVIVYEIEGPEVRLRKGRPSMSLTCALCREP
jgi:antitoxin PrlF